MTMTRIGCRRVVTVACDQDAQLLSFLEAVVAAAWAERRCDLLNFVGGGAKVAAGSWRCFRPS